jgi:adenylate kinase
MSILLFLGPPGSGKSTQANLISESLNIPLVSMGKLVRLSLEGSYKKYKESVINGNLLPDHIVFNILSDTIAKFDTNKGFVLEGYPRTIAQAVQLDELLMKRDLKIDMVLLLDLHDQNMIIKRLINRFQCARCGKSFDKAMLTSFSFCPVCQGNLQARADDTPLAVEQRMMYFQKEIDALVHFYGNKSLVYKVDATHSIQEVKNQILQLIQTNLNLEIHS